MVPELFRRARVQSCAPSPLHAEGVIPGQFGSCAQHRSHLFSLQSCGSGNPSAAALEGSRGVLHKGINKCHTMAFDTKHLVFLLMCWVMAASKSCEERLWSSKCTKKYKIAWHQQKTHKRLMLFWKYPSVRAFNESLKPKFGIKILNVWFGISFKKITYPVNNADHSYYEGQPWGTTEPLLKVFLLVYF